MKAARKHRGTVYGSGKIYEPVGSKDRSHVKRRIRRVIKRAERREEIKFSKEQSFIADHNQSCARCGAPLDPGHRGYRGHGFIYCSARCLRHDGLEPPEARGHVARDRLAGDPDGRDPSNGWDTNWEM